MIELCFLMWILFIFLISLSSKCTFTISIFLFLLH